MADPKQGGDLSQMAKDGTTIPGDAGQQNTIPSVPNPDQKDQPTAGGMGATSLHGAADNPIMAPNEDASSGVGEAVTATGHSLPQSTAEKHSGRGGT